MENIKVGSLIVQREGAFLEKADIGIVIRIKNRVTFDLNCPFCGVRMEQASMSGHRKEIKEERFKCPTGHRVSLIPSDEGVVGWK